jgi:alcohol dehydrogenase
LDLGKALNAAMHGRTRIAIGIPTTAGSGSEAHAFFTVTAPQTNYRTIHQDRANAYHIALLDPALPETAARHVTAMAGFDAIAHALETAVSTRCTPLSDTFAHRAWRLISDAFDRVLLHEGDHEAHAAMLLGAHFAGLAIDTSALGAAHACASPLTARFGIGHGLALAILLPHTVRWNGEVAKNRYEPMLGTPRRRARDEDPEETLARKLSDLALAARFAVRLRDTDVDEASLSLLAVDAAADPAAAFNPRPLDVSGALEIYRAAW